MDEFKPEDELKPDPSDRRIGRSRQSPERDNESQINFDDVDLDADDRHPACARKEHEEEQGIGEEHESDDDAMDEERVERHPRKRKKATSKPAPRQYMMMGVGVLVLLLLIIGIGSALKAPLSSSNEQATSGEKSIDPSGGNVTDQASATAPATGTEQTAGNTQQDASLLPISSIPTQGQAPAAIEGQQRAEMQGDLNNVLTQPQGQERVNNVVVNSMLSTEPATVAPMRNGNATCQTAKTGTTERPAATCQERKQAVIEPKSKPQATVKVMPTGPKSAAQAKPTVITAASTTTTKASVATTTPKTTAESKAAATPTQTTTPAPTAITTTTMPVAGGAKSAGNVGALKSAPSNHYTLQLSSSSNYDSLSGWMKKENLKNYVVYQTTRNGQPRYVLVTGAYTSKEDAKRVVSTLPADIQAKNPQAKPLHQVQADLK